MHKIQTTYYYYSNRVHYANVVVSQLFYILFCQTTIKFSITALHSRCESLTTVILLWDGFMLQRWIRHPNPKIDFRRHFNVPPRGTIPDRNTILMWMQNVWHTTESLLKKKLSEDKSKPFYKKCYKIHYVTLGNVWKKCIHSERNHLRDVILSILYTFHKIQSF